MLQIADRPLRAARAPRDSLRGVPSQDPDPAAQVPFEPGEAEREARSIFVGGALAAGAALGAALGAWMGGPAGVMVGSLLGAAGGALAGHAAGHGRPVGYPAGQLHHMVRWH